jgi:hypothetical protein
MRFRREAVDRAYQRFVAAEDVGRPDPEVGGLGMLVLQRSLLAAEDLGELLHAFLGTDPWARMVSAKVPDLDRAFEIAVTQPSVALSAFRLIDEEALASEPLDNDERGALEQLVAVARRRWEALLRSAAELWVTQGRNAKATMHGFPVVAGDHVLGPPPAGDLAVDINASPYGRFAVVLASRESDGHVTTDRSIVRLDRDAVLEIRAKGKSAAKLVGELCEAQANTIMSGHRVAVPLTHLDHLSPDHRGVIERLVERRLEDGDADA